MKKLFRNPRAKAATESLLLSLKLNNIQRFLFYFLILFIPTQFGRHFWTDFSFIKGARVDYLSPTLYATDILILLLFLFWVAQFLTSNFQFSIKSKFLILKFSIIIFILFLIVGISISKSPAAGFFGLIKLLEFGFLGIYTAQTINKLKLQNILLMFSIGIIFESSLTIAQYFNHGSLQGIFYYFGERFFTSQTPGIANASLGGELFLRPYGTFPHPNVLAGYLIVAMTLIFSGIKNYESRIKRIAFILTLTIGTIALFLTLSRIAIIIWVLILGFFLVRKFIINNSHFLTLLIIGFLFLGQMTPLGSRFTDIKITDESIVQREILINNSLAMIKDHPILGVGLNNFLVNLPSYQTPHTSLFYLQPVHNIFILIAAETGIAGLGFLTWFIYKTYKRIKEKKYIIRNTYYILLSSILVLGMFDHYFLTLQQGQLLLSFVLGLCWSKKSSSL